MVVDSLDVYHLASGLGSLWAPIPPTLRKWGFGLGVFSERKEGAVAVGDLGEKYDLFCRYRLFRQGRR